LGFPHVKLFEPPTATTAENITMNVKHRPDLEIKSESIYELEGEGRPFEFIFIVNTADTRTIAYPAKMTENGVCVGGRPLLILKGWYLDEHILTILGHLIAY
jgi:hypothetical protein